MNLLTLSGSPSPTSRSAALARLASQRFGQRADHHGEIAIAQLPPAALLSADTRHPAIAAAVERVLAADALLVATPIYKAAYSGLLKTFLDLLPQDALRGKTVLPLATGGSPAHLLALDYALKPVLSALGARHIVDAVYAIDGQLHRQPDGQYRPDDDLLTRLDRALQGLEERPIRRRPSTGRLDVPLLIAKFAA